MGIQYFIKSETAFDRLHEISDGLVEVDYFEFSVKYNQRDSLTRRKMRKLIDSDSNTATRVFSSLFKD
ncbi:MAG: hypothetical protein IJM54_07345 [Thermoguttaceae bacterium]|nr:hypothetical protein [Thermoguttaceae bacterium]